MNTDTIAIGMEIISMVLWQTHSKWHCMIIFKEDCRLVNVKKYVTVLCAIYYVFYES